MPIGIKFDIISNHDPIVKSFNAISGAVNRMSAFVKKAGGDIGNVFKRMADGGQTEVFERRAQSIANVFSKLVGNIGLAGDAADAARDRIKKAMDDFANSTERPKAKFQKFATELSTILNDIKTTEAPLGNTSTIAAIPALEQRLKLEADILTVLEQQKAAAEQQRNINAEGINRNKAKLEAYEERLSKKYNGAAEGFYDEADIALLESGREAVANWTKAWEDSNAQVQTCDALIAESNARTEQMKHSVEELNNVYKGFADTAESTATKIFISEDVFNRYHELARTIEDLKAQIQSMPDNDIDLPKLNSLQEELAKNQEEFRALDEAARHAAEVLGSDLAKKVESALEKLYDMNKAVELNQQRYDALEESLKKAKQQLAEAQDPVAITKAREEVDRLQKQLDECSNSLSKFKAERKDAVSEVQKLSNDINKSGAGGSPDGPDIANAVTSQAKELVGKVAAIAGIGLGLNELKDFFEKAREWREYFQDIESSMKVFLGSAEKGAEFTAKLKDYAYYNMSEFSDLAKASQQMISYGHNVDTIIPRLDQLSNVATGTHGSLMELVDAYNRAKATGVVDARGIQQWAVKGVMIKDVLRDMGETVSGTTISFDQLNKVLDKVTGEGGMFHNLMLSMMDNISAESGQLEDNLAAMYEEIGQKFEGVFVKWLKLQSAMAEGRGNFVSDELLDWGAEKANSALDYLLENWQKIINTIKDVVVAYGIYRAALIANNALEKASAAWKSFNAAAIKASELATKREMAAKIAETASEAANTAGTRLNTVEKTKNASATQLLALAQQRLQAVMAAHPYALVVAALGALAYACYAYHDSQLTAAESQKLLNDTAAEYAEQLKNQEGEIRSNISIIQSNTASLIAQTEAYKKLIQLRGIFANYSMEELKGMSSERIEALISRSSEEEMKSWEQRRYEAVQELQEKYKDAGIAFFHDADRRIDAMAEKHNLGEEWAKSLKDDIGSTTDLSDFFDRQATDAANELQDKLIEGAENGIIAGFKNGFSSPEVSNTATDVLKSLYSEITPLDNKTKENIESLKQYEEELRNLKNERESLKEQDPTGEAGAIQLRLLEIDGLLPKIGGKIEEIKRNQSEIDSQVSEISNKYKSQFQEQIQKAKEKVEELGNQMDKASGSRKAEIRVKWEKAIKDLDSYESIMKLIEAGDTEVVVRINRKIENIQLGDQALVKIGKDYEKIDDLAQEFMNRLGAARKEFAEMSGEGGRSAEEIAEAYGITSQSVEEDIDNAKKKIQDDIDELSKKLEDAKDENEARPLELEIQRKQEQLQYIDDLKTKLLDICKNPFDANILVNITGKVSGWVKKLLEMAGIIQKGENTDGTDISERGKTEGKTAQSNIDSSSTGSSTPTSTKYWKAEAEKDQKKRMAEYNRFLSGKGQSDDGTIDFSNLTQKEYEELKQRYKDVEQLMKKGSELAKQRAAAQVKEKQQAQKHTEEMVKLEGDAERAREDARIAGIKSAAERERAEREAQHMRTIEDIKRQEEDIYKKIYQDRKTAYETANKGKQNVTPFELTAEGKGGWQGLVRNSLESVQDAEKQMLRTFGKGDIMDALQQQFGNGNVDVLARPLIDAAELVRKGWTDAGDGIATVFSSSYEVMDKYGKSHEILVTPILPDGTVLSQKELEDYIGNSLEGADNILEADEKKLVIAVDIPVPDAQLQKLHEQLTDLPTDKIERIQELYNTIDPDPAIAAIRKIQQSLDTIDPSQLEGTFRTLESLNVSNLTEQENAMLREFLKKQASEAAKTNAALTRERLQSMRDYLKEYGTLEQQRMLITEEYEDKISAARAEKNEGAALKYTKELQKIQGQLTFENISKDIDWKALFGGIGAMSKQMMQEMMSRLQSYTKTDEFQKSGAENQEKVVQLMSELRSYLGSEDAAMTDLAAAMINFNNAVTRLETAQREEQSAKSQYEQAKGTDSEAKMKEAFDKASASVVEAQEDVRNFGTALNQASDAVVNYVSKLDVALKDSPWAGTKGFNSLQSASSDISRFIGDVNKKTAEDMAERLKGNIGFEQMQQELAEAVAGGDINQAQADNQLVSAFGTSMEKTLFDVKELLGGMGGTMEGLLSSSVGFFLQVPELILNLANSIKGMVTGILDSMTELISFEWLSDLVNSILKSIGNLVQAIFDLPANLFNALSSIITDGVGGLLQSVGNAITFGGLDTWLGNRSNAEDIMDYRKELMGKLEIINDSVKRMTDTLSESYGMSAVETAKGIEKLLEEQQYYYKENVLSAGNSDYGGRHSEWWHRNKNGGEDWRTFGGEVRHGYVDTLKKWMEANGYGTFKGTSWQNFFDYLGGLENGQGAEILSRIRETPELQKVWYELMRKDSYDNGQIAKAVTEWADSYEDIKKLKDQLNEQLLGTTAENIFNDFMNALYDMADGAEDVFDDIAESWQKMINRMMINNIVGQKLREELEKEYDTWAKEVEKANNIEDENKRRQAIDNANKTFYNAYSKTLESATDKVRELQEAGVIQELDEVTKQQSATVNSAQNITYEQADALAGILLGHTALFEQGRATSELILQNLQTMQAGFQGSFNELRNLTIQANGTRETMLKVMKEHYESFDTKLTNIYKQLQEA